MIFITKLNKISTKIWKIKKPNNKTNYLQQILYFNPINKYNCYLKITFLQLNLI